MRKVLWAAVLLLGALAATGAERALFPEGTALFAEPDFKSPLLGSFSGEAEVTAPPQRRYTASHPLAIGEEYFKVRLPDGREGYASMRIAGTSPDTLRRIPDFPTAYYFGALVAAGLFCVGVFRHVAERRSGKLAAGSAREEAYFVLEALALRYLLGFMNLAEFAGVIPAAADDNGYFEVGWGLWHGGFDRPWRFTLGNGIIYIPFIALTGAREFYDIAAAADHFNLLVTAPAALVLGFLVLRRLGVSLRGAATALFLAALWPFAACHLENWTACRFPAFFGIPLPDAAAPLGAWRFYRFCIGAGFNAMSDTPGLFTVLLTVYLALKLKPGKTSCLVLGACYGFACLIRINYCFFAPLVAFLWWRRLAEQAVPMRRWTPLALCAVAGFLAVFGWQLVVNWKDFGAPWRFGYLLHYLDFPEGQRPADGFTLRTFLEFRNLRFLFCANRAAWTLFFAGVWTLSDRALRSAFVLWALPVTVFFLGYYQTYCDAARFILPAFAAFFGAFGAAMFQAPGTGRRTAAFGTLLAVVLLGRLDPALGVPEALSLGAATVPAIAVAGWCFRSGDRLSAGILAAGTVLFILDQPFVDLALFALLALRAVADIIALFRGDRVEKSCAPC
jgi:hypothetical protein